MRPANNAYPCETHISVRKPDKTQCAYVAFRLPPPAWQEKHTHRFRRQLASPWVSSVVHRANTDKADTWASREMPPRSFVPTMYAGVPPCHVLRYRTSTTDGSHPPRHFAHCVVHTLTRCKHRRIHEPPHLVPPKYINQSMGGDLESVQSTLVWFLPLLATRWLQYPSCPKTMTELM